MFQQSQRIIFTFQGGNPDLAALCAECADQVFDTGVWLGFQQVVILVLGAENLGCVVRGVLVQSIEADERQLDGRSDKGAECRLVNYSSLKIEETMKFILRILYCQMRYQDILNMEITLFT